MSATLPFQPAQWSRWWSWALCLTLWSLIGCDEQPQPAPLQPMAPVKAPLPEPFEPSAHEQVDAALGPLPTAQTVGDLIDARKCSTGPTTTLNVQIAAEINCALPQAFAPIGHIPNISLGYGANPMMQAPAATALERAAARSPWLVMRVNSTWRSPLQQFILKSWEGSCGVGLAANPGRSQHESGLALDIPLESVYEFHDDLKAEGWRWFCDATNQGFANGCRDVPHYTASAGGRDMRALGLRAFGRLWNRAHPDDPIPVDGRFSKRTAARMRRAPLSGFPTGTTCGQSLPMAHSDRPFDDVPPSSPYRTAIEAHAELWGSCGEEGSRRFCPSKGVTRGELAMIVAQAMGLAPGAQRFDDVNPGSAQARAIGAVVQAGITQGCVVQEAPQQGGARFCPEAQVTWGQLAAWLARANHLTLVRPVGLWPDVGAEHPQASHIEAVTHAGMMRGCRGGRRFCPQWRLSRARMAQFMVDAGLVASP